MKNSLLTYCERINTAFETVNVVSNAGFALVSLVLFFLFWQRSAQIPNQKDRLMLLMSLLPLLIGAGSAAYHYQPSGLTLALDLGPIGLFAGASLYLCTRHILLFGRMQAIACFIVWLVATAIAAPWPGYLYGSLIYVPTLMTLIGVATLSRQKLLTRASLLFALALLVRTLDLPLCGQVTTGTHPAWHILTAFVSLAILLALSSVMQQRSPPCDQLHQPPRSHTN